MQRGASIATLSRHEVPARGAGIASLQRHAESQRGAGIASLQRHAEPQHGRRIAWLPWQCSRAHTLDAPAADAPLSPRRPDAWHQTPHRGHLGPVSAPQRSVVPPAGVAEGSPANWFRNTLGLAVGAGRQQRDHRHEHRVLDQVLTFLSRTSDISPGQVRHEALARPLRLRRFGARSSPVARRSVTTGRLLVTGHSLISQPVPLRPENNKQEPVAQKPAAVPDETVISIATKKSDLPATTIQTEQKKDVAGSLSKPEVKKQEIPVFRQEPVLSATTEETAATTKKSELVTTVKASEEKKFNTEASQASPIKITATVAALVLERKTVAPQIVTFKSDSLELALYDNGEIDGDTVSVLLNGEILMTKQGLKASAIKKTIYVQPGTEEVTLVLYAENLGKYPPNTGLLVVHDGEDTYQVRFSADLQQNAAVVFRRKRYRFYPINYWYNG